MCCVVFSVQWEETQMRNQLNMSKVLMLINFSEIRNKSPHQQNIHLTSVCVWILIVNVQMITVLVHSTIHSFDCEIVRILDFHWFKKSVSKILHLNSLSICVSNVALVCFKKFYGLMTHSHCLFGSCFCFSTSIRQSSSTQIDTQHTHILLNEDKYTNIWGKDEFKNTQMSGVLLSKETLILSWDISILFWVDLFDRNEALWFIRIR